MTGPSKSRIALLSTQLGGGIGRVNAHLSRCFHQQGFTVDVLLDKDWGHYVDYVRQDATVRRLRSTHAWTGIPELARYLRSARPAAVIADTPRLTHLAIRSARWARARPIVAAVVHSTYSLKFTELTERKRARRLRRMRSLYPLADRIIAVSAGVADDFAAYTGIGRERIEVIHNPVIPPGGITIDPGLDPCRPYRRPGESLIVGMGRLTAAKDFATLVRALARLRERRPARLVLFGDGGEHDRLAALAAELGLADAVVLAGHTDEPYAALAGADVFALSSQWEGFGNVLVEAMAVGTPVVATDCPNGPREILEDGRWGRLVPPGDDAALAEALDGTLADPPDGERLRAAVARFDSHRVARQYLDTLGLPSGAEGA